jgi:hypothetical protein
MARGYTLSDDIQLPVPTAVWVLGAHIYALLVPLVLITALLHHWQGVAERADYPVLLLFAAGLMMAGSAFEIAQNGIDKWYLTPATGSAEGTGFCDFLFYWFIVASQGFVALACMGENPAVLALSIVLIATFPFFYLRQIAPFMPLAVLGLLSVFTAYVRFEDPVIVLQLLLSPLTMYFFGLLLKTGAQMLHGFTTAAASSGVLFLAWGIHGGVEARPQSWEFVLTIIGITVLVAAALRPLLLKLEQTPRRMT